MLIQGFAENVGHGLEEIAGKSSAHIQSLEVITNVRGLVEYDAGVLHCPSKTLRVRRAGSNMEANPTTLRSRSFAKVNRSFVVSIEAPYLSLSRHAAEESSVRIRRNSSASGKKRLIL